MVTRVPHTELAKKTFPCSTHDHTHFDKYVRFNILTIRSNTRKFQPAGLLLFLFTALQKRSRKKGRGGQTNATIKNSPIMLRDGDILGFKVWGNICVVLCQVMETVISRCRIILAFYMCVYYYVVVLLLLSYYQHFLVILNQTKQSYHLVNSVGIT